MKISKGKVVSEIMLMLLLMAVSTSVFNIQSVKAVPTVTSGWLTFPVTFDGEMTTVEEWSDTIPVDVTLLEWGVGPGAAPARVWMKNDDTWLYMLYRVQWPAGMVDPYDSGFIAYCWDWIGEPPPLWDQSDLGTVWFDNATGDFHGWDEYSWTNDLLASPPGENNVEGAATHDGTCYWFEFRKELDSGDVYDWAFTPGQIIETVAGVSELSIALYDATIDGPYQAYISLHLSSGPPIDLGMIWLAEQQNLDGSWGTWDQVAKTGFAVLKFETHAIQECIDPLDPGYQYYAQVRNGLNYIFANAYTMAISMQPAGDPDTDGDGIGVYFVSGGAGGFPRTYETSIAMMAIATSTHPAMLVSVPGSAVDGWTYEEVLQDAVDYLSFGQNELGYGQGGWGYDANMGPSDNSNTGYAVLGLAYAEAPTIDGKKGFACTIPAFVRSELNIWIDYIQNNVGVGDPTDDGGSGYTGPDDWVNILKTGHLLFEMAFYGDTAATPRVQDAIDYLVRHWNDANDDPGWKGQLDPLTPPFSPPASYQAMYATMKGLEMLGIAEIDGVDWQADFADVLVAQQNLDGSWPPCIWDDGEMILSTEWALLTLQKTVPPPPPETMDLELYPREVVYLEDPTGTQWHELHPDKSNHYHLTSWEPGMVLSPCDQIVMDGEEFEVDEVTIALTVYDEMGGIYRWLDYKCGYWTFDPDEPICTKWNEIKPEPWLCWHLTGWDDNGDGELSYCDWIEMTLMYPFGPAVMWFHVEQVTVTVKLTSKIDFEQRYLEFMGTLDEFQAMDYIHDPMSTMWHEIWPEQGRIWHLSSWEDSFIFSPSDQIVLALKDEFGEPIPGTEAEYHVDKLTVAMNLTSMLDGKEHIVKFEGSLKEFMKYHWYEPWETQWHEVNPTYCRQWYLADWLDTNGNGILDYCDLILMIDKETGELEEFHVEALSTDIVITKKPPPPWYWKEPYPDYAPSGMPDFSQKQDNWGKYYDTNITWTWCGPTAVADCLWWMDSKFEPGVIPPPTFSDGFPLVQSYDIWDDHDPQNVPPLIEDLAWYMDCDGIRTNPCAWGGTFVDDMTNGINEYIHDKGLEGSLYAKMVEMPDFYFIEHEVKRSEDVILLVGFWQWDPDKGMWARIGGHYLTVAGVNSEAWLLAVSDPYGDWAEPPAYPGDPDRGNGPGRVIPPPPHGHPTQPPSPTVPDTVHNNATYISHDIYKVTPSESPGGIWQLEGYISSKEELVENMAGQNCPREFVPRIGGYIPGEPVYTEIEYAVVVSPIHDVAVIDVTPHKTVVAQGQNCTVRINVTVENQGDFTETFDVTVYYGNATITYEQWETFWSMGDINRDGYIDPIDVSILNVAYGSAPGDPNWCLWADLDQDGFVGPIDAAILSGNFGLDIWTYFTLKVVIGTQTVTNLSPGTSTTLVFTWNTTGVAYGNYTISAYAVPILCVEVDRADNNYGDGIITVTIAGDVNGDGIVDGFDFSLMGAAYRAEPGDPNWNEDCDINGDGIVDGFDFSIAGGNYRKTV